MWKDILTQEDINGLMEFFSGFHDSCITGLAYHSGIFVADDGSMTFGKLDDCSVSVLFHSQWEQSIELLFSGVRKIHIVGVEDNYIPDIYDATLAFYENILPNKYLPNAERSIVWADYEGFSVNDLEGGLSEPDNSYIVATWLKWRIVK